VCVLAPPRQLSTATRPVLPPLQMPDIFPGGNAGIRNLTATTGWKVIAHNRYWSADTTYATQNGGAWQFYVDAPSSPAGGSMAVPLQQEFWEWLLTDAAKSWCVAMAPTGAGSWYRAGWAPCCRDADAPVPVIVLWLRLLCAATVAR